MQGNGSHRGIILLIMENEIRPRVNLAAIARGLMVLAGVSILGVWLILTPEGILGKADAIGYSVCHRIAERSFFVAGRQMPLCARCTGMYLGMLAGLIFQLPRGRRSEFPPLKIILPLSILFAVFALDGINSFLVTLPTAPHLYEPTNFLRLMTGAGLGMLVPLFLLPVFNQTLWDHYDPRRAIDRWPQALVLIGIVALAALGVTTRADALLWPLALLSSLTVPLILTMCYALLWIIIFRRENSYPSLKSAWLPLLAGFSTAMLQIGLIDLLRYHFTGTWAGFVL